MLGLLEAVVGVWVSEGYYAVYGIAEGEVGSRGQKVQSKLVSTNFMESKRHQAT
jgi:hypothetical protein